jgi:1-aminocyclopropane-1-carboxylate deaminase
MIEIANPFSPIETLNIDAAKNAGVEILLKREDLSHPFISGNKWRKLKYYLIDARLQQKSILATFGGAYSNHLLATACAGAKYGFKSIGFVRGNKVSNHMLQLCKLFGMDLYFVSYADYAKHKLEIAKKQLLHVLNEVYFINEGGSGLLGEKGVSEIIDEVKNKTDVLFCAIGTGSTFAGLLHGVNKQKLNIQLHGILVLKGMEESLEHRFKSYGLNYTLHNQYNFGGYAKVNPVLKTFVQEMAANTGVLFDYVYEAKMMYGLIDLIKQGCFKQGTRIMALHNGGTLSMLSML